MAARASTKLGEAPAPLADNPAGDNLGVIVGQNIKRLRSRRNLSLDALAKISGVSRAMLGQIETGRSVPTINVVWKIARAFEVPFSTLIASGSTEAIRMMPAAEAKRLTSASGDFSSRALFPFDGERRSEFYELRLKPHGVEEAEAHPLGTTENLVVVQGRLDMEIAGQHRELGPGDAIMFQADLPHIYRNPGADPLLAYLVMGYVEPTG
jgi:transcriptional regulator with XRE-family HTH domain